MTPSMVCICVQRFDAAKFHWDEAKVKVLLVVSGENKLGLPESLALDSLLPLPATLLCNQ